MCLNPLRIPNPRRFFDSYYDPLYLDVPCNNCYECYQNKAFDLTIRGVVEYDRCKSLGGQVYNYTLTYSEDCVPRYLGFRALCRRDMQLFKKRLKKRLGADGDKVQIFYAGEYGKRNTKRCHFHILLFSEITFDYKVLAKLVKDCWRQGNIGYPERLINGKLVCNNPITTIVDGINAISYCMKYCAKQLDYFQFCYNYFSHWLYDHGVEHSEFENFEFPQDQRFRMSSKKDYNIYYICSYFSRCYRCPNNFGLSQKDNLDENFVYHSSLKNGQSYLEYPISRYLKQKLFNINCILSKETKFSHKTPLWTQYILKKYNKFATDFQSLIESNRNLQLKYHPIYDSVKTALEDLSAKCKCSIADYFIYKLVVPNPALSRLSIPEIIYYRQRRFKLYLPTDVDYADSYFIPHWIDTFDAVLIPIVAEIKYNKYLKRCEDDNKYQDLKAAIHGTQPRYIIPLPFNEFINMRKIPKHPIESEVPPKNYGIRKSSDGKTDEVVEVLPPSYPKVDTFDLDVLSASGIVPNQVTTPYLEQSVESFESDLNKVDYFTKPAES